MNYHVTHRAMNCCACASISFYDNYDIGAKDLLSLERDLTMYNGGYMGFGAVNQYQMKILKKIKAHFTSRKGYSVTMIQKIKNIKSDNTVTIFCIRPHRFTKVKK